MNVFLIAMCNGETLSILPKLDTGTKNRYNAFSVRGLYSSKYTGGGDTGVENLAVFVLYMLVGIVLGFWATRLLKTAAPAWRKARREFYAKWCAQYLEHCEELLEERALVPVGWDPKALMALDDTLGTPEVFSAGAFTVAYLAEGPAGHETELLVIAPAGLRAAIVIEWARGAITAWQVRRPKRQPLSLRLMNLHERAVAESILRATYVAIQKKAKGGLKP
jgi:hypothetical protein